MDRLIINNEDLDLYANTRINLNLRVADIADISARTSTFSNTLTLPRTAKNERLLSMAGTMGNTSRTPYLKVGCNYIKDNIPLIKNGFMYLAQTTPSDYKLNLFDGNINFTDALGDQTLRDLDYSAELHNLNLTNYGAAMSKESGYTYGVADFGKPVDTVVAIENQLPVMYAHTVWQMIFDQNGLSCTGDFFTDNTDFKELVISPAKGIEITETALTETNLGTGTTDTITIDTLDPFYVGYYTKHDIDTDDWNADLNLSGTDLLANFDGTLKLALSTVHTTDRTFLRLLVRVNGIVRATVQLDGEPSPKNTELLIEVSTGDLISFHTEAGSTDEENNNPSFKTDFSTTTTIQAFKVTGGTTIDVSETVSDLKQVDFVKDIMQRYGLIMLRSKIDPNRYRFIQLEQLLNDRAGAVDYSDKLIEVKGEKYDSGYAINNTATYRYRRDTVPFLDGSLIIDVETTESQKNLFSSPFTVPNLSEGDKYSFLVYELKDGEYEIKEIEPSLMRLSQPDPLGSFNFFGSTTTNIDDPNYLSLDNMGMQYFLDNYYTRFKWLLDSYKEIEVEMDLNPIDIMAVDFFKLVYLKQTGRYYLLDSIRTGTTTTAKLIEINRFN